MHFVLLGGRRDRSLGEVAGLKLPLWQSRSFVATHTKLQWPRAAAVKDVRSLRPPEGLSSLTAASTAAVW